MNSSQIIPYIQGIYEVPTKRKPTQQRVSLNQCDCEDGMAHCEQTTFSLFCNSFEDSGDPVRPDYILFSYFVVLLYEPVCWSPTTEHLLISSVRYPASHSIAAGLIHANLSLRIKN